MFKKALLGALAATAFALPAAAQDYVVGVTAALTGPPSSTYAPAVDAMRLYIDRVNAAGGINGRKIRLVIEDDGAQPSKAAANTKKLITQDNVMLMVNASLSSTYAPVIAETKSAEVPLLFASGVCPQSVYPPADPLQFCTTGYASHFDSQATLDFIKATAKGPVKIGFSAMAIPLSRGEMDYAMDLSKKVGMEPVDQEVIPPPTADYTPFATKLKDAGPNWVYSWAPWVTQVRTLEALRKLGCIDDYLAWGHLEAEAELVRLKDSRFYVVNSNALFEDNLPIQKEIEAAA
jgi:branched-chain amino acid transport system substrate-binding protein